MAFTPAASTRSKIEHPDIKFGYFTKPRKENKNNAELEIIIRGDFLEETGIEPGERCMLEIDKVDGLGRIASGNQHGWVLKPFKKGSALYRLRLAWKPDTGLPLVECRQALNILQSGDGEIIFELPTSKTGGAK